MRLFRFAAAAATLFAHSALAAAEPPVVVVSITPLHSLVAAVMDGVGKPVLLVQAGADPHSHALKPSEARELDRAKLVIWSGPGVETFLEKPIRSLAGKARVVELDKEKSLVLHKSREGAEWEDEDDDHDHKGEKEAEHHHHGPIDGHLWLDPRNAVGIVRIAVRELSQIDKANAAAYAANGRQAEAALTALDKELAAQFAPLKGRRFIVSHDSTQYLEKRYGLAAAGSITISPERPASAKRLHEIRARIEKHQVVCVFAEPQIPDRLVRTLVEGTKTRTGVLDTDGGMGVPPGKDAYLTIMRNIGKAIVGCLGA
ncbi:MAG: zinc ABC transporter substrate-binding protein [Rhodospirillaceae bacterium]|nr:zinc ABC transporter substrate-binding protein [Rhodospirillaceae bacterium]